VGLHKKKRENMSKNKMDKIFDFGVLVQLKVGYWTGQRRLLPSDIGFKDELPRDLINLGQLNLMAKDVRASIRSVESSSRYYLKLISFPFPIGEAHFVPKDAIAEMIEHFEVAQKEFEAVKVDYLRKYISIRNRVFKNFRERMPDIFKVTSTNGDYEKFLTNFMNRLELIYPTKQEIASRFRFDWNLYEISLPKVKKKTDQYYAKRAELNKQYERDYRAKAMDAMDGFLGDVVTELRTKTVDVCSFVIDKINKGEVVTEKNIQNLQNFIERFSKLNFVDDSDISQQLAELNKGFLKGRGNQFYKDNATATNKLKKKLKNITQSAQNISDVSNITGRFKRKIVI